MLKSFYLILFLLGGSIFLSLVVMSPPTPPGPMAPYLNGLFPSTTPGAAGAWGLEDAMPNVSIPMPVRMIPFANTPDVLILSKMGELWRVNIENQTQQLVMDIKDRTFFLSEAGAIGLVLHPEFETNPNKQWLFLFYRSKPNPQDHSDLGYNRLSKFKWNENTNHFEENSEEILIQQYDRSPWHGGGGLFFGADDFLYLSLGDEGFDEFQTASTQRLDGGLFSGIIRIDVDNDSSRSHPIRRQPLPNEEAPAGWWNTYTEGYSIPNDNPWISPDSSNLEEFFAIGVRSPYSMIYDVPTDQIWLADVGSDKREEITKDIRKGDNLQWPYREGTHVSALHQKPEPLIGTDKEPFIDFERSLVCLIGGGIYHHDRYPELKNKYLFGDYTRKKIYALDGTGSTASANYESLTSLWGHGLGSAIPEAPAITGVFLHSDGHIYFSVVTIDPGMNKPGKIFRLKQNTYVPDPPLLLSELNVFTDLNNLTPAPGIIPYGINAPLWSDGAIKKRWVAIPNDGQFDSKEEQITFSGNQDWRFPEGTVFIKHFELPITTDPDGATAKIETRFFIVGKDSISYGLTYQWNEAGTDATLMGGATSRDFDIYENGTIVATQTWDFPSRDQCLDCHTQNASYILGVKTHQLNGELFYPKENIRMNQLEYLNQIGVFHHDIGNPAIYPKAYALDDTTAALDRRIFSYLDANCASCHRPNGVPMVEIDLRFETPLPLKNLIRQPTGSLASDPDRLMVQPGQHQQSELWVRDASGSENKMPPIGRNRVDEVYIKALAEWIDQLDEGASIVSKLTLIPNPANDWLRIVVEDHWTGSIHLNIWTLSGVQVLQTDFEAPMVHLNIGGLAAGAYVVEVLVGELRSWGRLVVL